MELFGGIETPDYAALIWATILLLAFFQCGDLFRLMG